jgi:hypothetical protein
MLRIDDATLTARQPAYRRNAACHASLTDDY